VRQAFELMATGKYKKTEALKVVTDAGLRTRKGKKLSPQTFEAMLKKPIYCGYVTASCLDSPVKGLHTPIVSEELFRSVQDILNGRRVSVAPKRKLNPRFPLKWVVRCDSCGTPITAGLVTGKNKSRQFGYYWCRKSGCRAMMVRSERLEALFVEHLRRLQPQEEVIAEFPQIAERVWTERQGDAEAAARKLRVQLEEQKRLKSELLRAKLRGEINQADYQQANSEFDTEITAIQEQLRLAQASRVGLEAFVRFAKTSLLDIAGAWQVADAEQKLRVQTLLFGYDLRYNQKLENFEHPNSCLFNVMRDMSGKNWWLASPAGFEPAFAP
jgi:site-specific DNA recombinase